MSVFVGASLLCTMAMYSFHCFVVCESDTILWGGSQHLQHGHHCRSDWRNHLYACSPFQSIQISQLSASLFITLHVTWCAVWCTNWRRQDSASFYRLLENWEERVMDSRCHESRPAAIPGTGTVQCSYIVRGKYDILDWPYLSRTDPCYCIKWLL